jgi:tRNA pseudouridine13 synthase
MSTEESTALFKSRPDDFFVRENSLVNLVNANEATHRYFLLQKCGFTTMEAIALIAKAGGIAPAEISYSGLKDEDAVTEQLIAAPKAVEPCSATMRGDEAADRWWRLSHYGYGCEPLQIGYLAGNTFHVRLRNLGRATAEAFKRERWLNLAFINYYDSQRFGLPGKQKVTHRIGEAILAQRWRHALELVVESQAPEGEEAAAWREAPEDFFRARDPRLINFYLAAAASYLWNDTLAALVRQSAAQSATTSAVEGMEFTFMSSATDVMRLMSELPSMPHKRFALSGGTIVPQNLSRATGVHTVVQVGTVAADDLNHGRYAARVGFALPAGCYGTMALRQLMHFLAQNEKAASC